MDLPYIPATSVSSGQGQDIHGDLYCYCMQIVNVCLVGKPTEHKHWVLVDTGMPKSADAILEAANERFGANNHPRAIILTHGHFDHVGAVAELAKHWNVNVYAHELEFPFLTGKAAYPEPDPSVEGGLVAKASFFFPNQPIEISSHLHKLPANGSVPEMPGWRWIHTPGHSPGHISLFRDEDRALIAGDAFVTVRQDSLYKVLLQEAEVNGPPRYFTTDWACARESVSKLAALSPSVAITGHGQPMANEELAQGLAKLVRDFDSMAVPDYGKYVETANS